MCVYCVGIIIPHKTISLSLSFLFISLSLSSPFPSPCWSCGGVNGCFCLSFVEFSFVFAVRASSVRRCGAAASLCACFCLPLFPSSCASISLEERSLSSCDPPIPHPTLPSSFLPSREWSCAPSSCTRIQSDSACCKVENVGECSRHCRQCGWGIGHQLNSTHSPLEACKRLFVWPSRPHDSICTSNIWTFDIEPFFRPNDLPCIAGVVLILQESCILISKVGVNEFIRFEKNLLFISCSHLKCVPVISSGKCFGSCAVAIWGRVRWKSFPRRFVWFVCFGEDQIQFKSWIPLLFCPCVPGGFARLLHLNVTKYRYLQKLWFEHKIGVEVFRLLSQNQNRRQVQTDKYWSRKGVVNLNSSYSVIYFSRGGGGTNNVYILSLCNIHRAHIRISL